MISKKKGFSENIKGFLHLIRDYRRALILGAVLSLFGSLFSAIGPVFLSQITDGILEGIRPAGNDIDLEAVADSAMLLIVFYLFSGACTVSYRYLIPATSQRIAAFVRELLVKKIDKLPFGFLDTCRSGDLLSRLTNDTDNLGEESGNGIVSLVTSVSVLLVSIVLMLCMSPVLTAVVLIPAVAGFFAMRYAVKHTQHYYVQQSKDMGRINALVNEVYTNQKVVKSYDSEPLMMERFEEYNGSLFHSTRRSRFVTGILPQLMSFVNNIGYVLSCLVGLVLVMHGEITYGVIVAFIIYSKNLGRPMQQMSEAIGSLQSVAASYERISYILDQPEMPDESNLPEPEEVKGDICFEDVSFGYSEDKRILKDISFDVRAGTKVAIVGPTGSGKTTIMNLLLKNYDTYSGSIRIDGVPLKEIGRDAVHDMFTAVMQESWIFSGTLRENVVFNQTGRTDSEIMGACEKAGLKGFVEGLPDGLDTVLGGDLMLSEGQKQQISIARSILKDAPMVLMDEATSSIDTRTERAIQDAMESMMAGKTSFIIAHRLSTIRNCDTILVVRDGEIIESGSHEELLGKGGFYCMLYNSQFENCE